MSNSTRSRTPHRSVRYLRMPDAVLRSVASPDRKPSAESLQRAVATLGAPAAGPAQRGPAGAPPVRDRIFSGELRDVTGAVLGHGPGAPRSKASSPGDQAQPGGPARRLVAPLAPPPAGEKPWLKNAPLQRVEPRPLPSRAPRPWLKAPPPGESTSGAQPGDRAASAAPEVVIMEAAEVDDAPAATRGHDANVELLVVEESLAPPASVPESEHESSAPPPRQKMEARDRLHVVRPEPAPADAQARRPSPGPATAPPRESFSETIARPGPAAAPRPPESVASQRIDSVETVVYAAPEPLFDDAYGEPIVELPDFPAADPIVDLPDELEQERIVVLPAEEEPERIVDLPDEAVAALFADLDACDERYVPGLIFEYEYEYVDESGEVAPGVRAGKAVAPPSGTRIAESTRDRFDPPGVSDGPGEPGTHALAAPEVVDDGLAQTPPRPRIAITEASSDSLQISPESVDQASGEADELKQEFYAEIAGDLERELEPEADFDLDSDLDARIDAELSKPESVRTAKSTAADPQVMAEPLAPTAEKAQAITGEGDLDILDEDLNDVLLDDNELADHILASDPKTPLPTERVPADPIREPLSETERHRLHDRLESVWHATPAPTAVSDPALLENLRRLHTVSQPRPEHFEDLLAFLIDKTRADALAVLLLDTAQMVYRPVLSSGLDGRTATNLYLGLDDAFLGGPPDFQVLRKTDHASGLANFKKRFASDFFHRMDGLFLMALHPYGVSGFLVLIFNDLELLTDHVLRSMLPPILKDALPALQRYAMEIHEAERLGAGDEDGFEDTSIVDQIYRLLKEASRGGRDSIEVLHLHFPNLLQEQRWRVRLGQAADALLKNIQPDERLIETTPERITLILKSTPAAELLVVTQDFAREHKLELRHRLLVYPQHSRNFFNYIAPGL